MLPQSAVTLTSEEQTNLKSFVHRFLPFATDRCLSRRNMHHCTFVPDRVHKERICIVSLLHQLEFLARQPAFQPLFE